MTILVLGAWSAGIFSHGVASLFFYRPEPTPPAQAGWLPSLSVVASVDGLAPGLSLNGVFR